MQVNGCEPASALERAQSRMRPSVAIIAGCAALNLHDGLIREFWERNHARVIAVGWSGD